MTYDLNGTALRRFKVGDRVRLPLIPPAFQPGDRVRWWDRWMNHLLGCEVVISKIDWEGYLNVEYFDPDGKQESWFVSPKWVTLVEAGPEYRVGDVVRVKSGPLPRVPGLYWLDYMQFLQGQNVRVVKIDDTENLEIEYIEEDYKSIWLLSPLWVEPVDLVPEELEENPFDLVPGIGEEAAYLGAMMILNDREEVALSLYRILSRVEKICKAMNFINQ